MLVAFILFECTTLLEAVLLARDYPAKVLVLATMIIVKNRMNSVKLKHMTGWLFAASLGLGSARCP